MTDVDVNEQAKANICICTITSVPSVFPTIPKFYQNVGLFLKGTFFFSLAQKYSMWMWYVLQKQKWDRKKSVVCLLVFLMTVWHFSSIRKNNNNNDKDNNNNKTCIGNLSLCLKMWHHVHNIHKCYIRHKETEEKAFNCNIVCETCLSNFLLVLFFCNVHITSNTITVRSHQFLSRAPQYRILVWLAGQLCHLLIIPPEM